MCNIGKGTSIVDTDVYIKLVEFEKEIEKGCVCKLVSGYGVTSKSKYYMGKDDALKELGEIITQKEMTIAKRDETIVTKHNRLQALNDENIELKKKLSRHEELESVSKDIDEDTNSAFKLEKKMLKNMTVREFRKWRKK